MSKSCFFAILFSQLFSRGQGLGPDLFVKWQGFADFGGYLAPAGTNLAPAGAILAPAGAKLGFRPGLRPKSDQSQHSVPKSIPRTADFGRTLGPKSAKSPQSVPKYIPKSVQSPHSIPKAMPKSAVGPSQTPALKTNFERNSCKHFC